MVIKILITGATGFIGRSFLSRFVADKNCELYGIGRREAEDLSRHGHYHALALNQLKQLDFMPDVVIHSAGRASPWGTQAEYYRDNVATTQEVIDFCRQRKFPRLILLSSAAVYYQFAHQFSLTETSPIGPNFINRYAKSKYLAEQLVEQYEGEKSIFRPCGVFGEGDKLLFPPLLTAAKKGQLVRLHSAAEPAKTDLMHVDTLCDYLMAAALHAQPRRVYNISANEPIVIEQLLDSVLTTLDLPLPKKMLRLSHALGFAAVIESLWRWLPLQSDPPITRFGIATFGYSSTLDVSPMIHDFGPPKASLSHHLNHFLSQHKALKK